MICLCILSSRYARARGYASFLVDAFGVALVFIFLLRRDRTTPLQTDNHSVGTRPIAINSADFLFLSFQNRFRKDKDLSFPKRSGGEEMDATTAVIYRCLFFEEIGINLLALGRSNIQMVQQDRPKVLDGTATWRELINFYDVCISTPLWSSESNHVAVNSRGK